MAAVAEFQCVPTPLIPAGFGSEFRPEPQGEAGKVLLRNAEAVYIQWVERAEVLIATTEDNDAFTYSSMPPNRVFHVKTRYVFLGKGEPMPFELDDE